MGMTDSQFKGFIRFLITALVDALKTKDEKERAEKFQQILDNLQKTIED